MSDEVPSPHTVARADADPVACAPSSLRLVDLARRVAASDCTVLIVGESGTGKEVIARFLHRASSRPNGPFVALNCAALPEQLLEAELFGYDRGAFTGATQSKPGQLEQASGGTLFLDEVGAQATGSVSERDPVATRSRAGARGGDAAPLGSGAAARAVGGAAVSRVCSSAIEPTT